MQKLLVCLFLLVALSGLALTVFVFTPVSAHTKTAQKAANYGAVQLRVYCRIQPGLLKNVYIIGNDPNNVPRPWLGTSPDHYSVTTSNWWWQGYVYVQWQLYNGYHNHAYYLASSSTNNPYPVPMNNGYPSSAYSSYPGSPNNPYSSSAYSSYPGSPNNPYSSSANNSYPSYQNNPYSSSASVNCQTNTPTPTPTPAGIVPNSSPGPNTVQLINVC
jgi:hypothetical protein